MYLSWLKAELSKQVPCKSLFKGIASIALESYQSWFRRSLLWACVQLSLVHTLSDHTPCPAYKWFRVRKCHHMSSVCVCVCACVCVSICHRGSGSNCVERESLEGDGPATIEDDVPKLWLMGFSISTVIRDTFHGYVHKLYLKPHATIKVCKIFYTLAIGYMRTLLYLLHFFGTTLFITYYPTFDA